MTTVQWKGFLNTEKGLFTQKSVSFKTLMTLFDNL